MAAALDKAKAFGFKYVEVAGTGDVSPAEFKSQLDQHGLVPISGHFSYERLQNDIEGVAREAKARRARVRWLRWIDHKSPFDEKQCRDAAIVFNRAGAALASIDLKFFYHNHGYEFEPYGQGTLFDLLVAETDPKLVSFEMDVMWTVFPAQDPVKLLEKYPNRWSLMHLKDLKKVCATGSLSGDTDLTNNVTLGTGQVDWPPLLRTAQKVGVKYTSSKMNHPPP